MRTARWGLVPALVAAPGQAMAHGGLPGGGGFYSGVSHPFLAVEQCLALLALGLMLGQASGPFARMPLVVLALALMGGLAIGGVGDYAEVMTLGLALIFGLLLAAAVRVPVWALAGAAALTGWIVGADTDVPAPVAADPVEAYAPFAGVVVGVFLVTLNAAALSSVAQPAVARIAVRIAGSWIAAIALMVLALRIRGILAL